MRRLASFAAVALLAGCAAYRPPEAPSAAVARATVATVPVYVAYNGFHAGLIAPSAAIAAHPGPTADALARLAPRPWTSLGYGDSKFYRHQGINPPRALDFLRSMLAPDNPSVVQVRGVEDPLHDQGHPHLMRLAIPDDAFGRLVARVDAAFALTDGRPRVVAPGQDADDLFFAGERPASALHECNQWVGQVLGAAGVPHSYLLDTTSYGLAADLTASGRAVRVHAPPVDETAPLTPGAPQPGSSGGGAQTSQQ